MTIALASSSALERAPSRDLALGMIERAVRDGIPGDIVLADAFYGNAHEFRETVRQRGVDNTPQPSELVGSVDFCRRISGSYWLYDGSPAPGRPSTRRARSTYTWPPGGPNATSAYARSPTFLHR
ncbi:transposase [Sorangium sp. So ce128]|uniref:transposase n=1 Tax=Sorangium sp. So ce128 TaxID=3133281 RepID=UPI003F5D9FA2